MKPHYALIRITRGLTLGLSLLQAKNKVFKSYRKNKTNIQLFNKLNALITKSKLNYYEHKANKLNNLQRNPKQQKNTPNSTSFTKTNL